MTPPSLTRKVAWLVDGRPFVLSADGDEVVLEAHGCESVSLSASKWDAVRAGLDELARFGKRPSRKARVDRSTPDAPNNGQAWTVELDAALCRGWYAGQGLAALSERFGRTSGSIASRLARLDCVADRDEARARP